MAHVALISWLLFSVLAGMYASKLNRSGGVYFVASLLLSPLIVFLVLLIVGEFKDENLYIVKVKPERRRYHKRRIRCTKEKTTGLAFSSLYLSSPLQR